MSNLLSIYRIILLYFSEVMFRGVMAYEKEWEQFC